MAMGALRQCLQDAIALLRYYTKRGYLCQPFSYFVFYIVSYGVCGVIQGVLYHKWKQMNKPLPFWESFPKKEGYYEYLQ